MDSNRTYHHFHHFHQCIPLHRHPEVRAKSALDLRLFVESELRDNTSEASEKFVNELTGRVFDLVNSVDVYEKLGGIKVIDELIELKCDFKETMIVRFANCFRILFQQSTYNSDPIVLEMASKALGAYVLLNMHLHVLMYNNVDAYM